MADVGQLFRELLGEHGVRRCCFHVEESDLAAELEVDDHASVPPVCRDAAWIHESAPTPLSVSSEGGEHSGRGPLASERLCKAALEVRRPVDCPELGRVVPIAAVHDVGVVDVQPARAQRVVAPRDPPNPRREWPDEAELDFSRRRRKTSLLP